MAALSIQVPYPVFYDRDGQPIDNGNIYIGDANLDPITNPLQVYYDEALTITASQPLVTSAGYVYRNGTPTQIYVDATDFSITVNDSKNLLVYNFPTSTGIGVNAASIEYDPPFTGAVTSGYTVADKLSQTVSVKDFGAVGDGVTDDTAAINLFLAVCATGQGGYIPSGTYKFTSALTTISGNSISIVGDGASSILIYGGVSTTPGNLLSIGDGAAVYDNIQLLNFRIDSTPVLTSGAAVRIRSCRRINVDIQIDGPSDSVTSNCYDGLWLDSSTLIYLNNSRFTALNTSLIWNDGIALHCGNTFIKGNVVGGFGTGIGILLAGGCADFNSENVSQLLNDIGLRIDNSLSASANQQIFIGADSKFDTNKTSGITLNDSVAATLSKVIKIDAWVASTVTGANITVANWTNGRIDSSCARILNATAGSGIYSADTTITLNVSDGVVISNNSAYGIDAVGALQIACSATLFSNALGPFSANITVAGVSYGTQTLTQDPTLGWLFSSTPNSLILADSANVKLADGSGLIMITNTSNGDNGLYLIGGGSVSFISSNAGTFDAPSTTPAAGKVSVAWNGSTGYNIYSNFGSQETYIASLLLKSRDVV